MQALTKLVPIVLGIQFLFVTIGIVKGWIRLMVACALVIAMAKSPAERYRSYNDFRMAMEASRSQLLIGQLRAKKETGAVGRSWWRR